MGKVRPGEKIDCPHCLDIWETCRKYSVLDFKDGAKQGGIMAMTVEQALRKESGILHRRNAALKKRIKLFITTCEKRKKQLQLDAKFSAAVKRKDPDLHADIVSEITGIGPSKSCYECREDGMECSKITARRSKECLANLKEKNDRS